MTDQADRFDLHLADALDAYAASGLDDTDAYAIADAMLATRQRRRTRWAMGGIGAVIAVAVLAGIVIGGITQPLPDVGPSASASASSISPTVAPTAMPPAQEALPDGTFAITTVEVPVHAEPAAGEPFFTLAGQGFYIRGNQVAPDGSLWHEAQFAMFPFGQEWVFGWIPTEIDGQDVIIPQDPQPCPTPDEFANGILPDAPRLVACLEEGNWRIEGFLIRVPQLGDVPYAGEPAWLVGPSEWALSGAIGPAVSSWQLPLYFDPNPELEIDIDDAWISDRDAHEGLRVWIQGGVAHPAARECQLTATDPALADPTELQAIGFCQQRFVVTALRPAE